MVLRHNQIAIAGMKIHSKLIIIIIYLLIWILLTLIVYHKEVHVYSIYTCRSWLISRFSLYARSNMSHRLISLFFVCAILNCVYASSSCWSTIKYTCGEENFYCPRTQRCLPYSSRCTDMIGGSTDATICQQTSYTDCDYNITSGEFKAYRCSSSLLRKKKLKPTCVPAVQSWAPLHNLSWAHVWVWLLRHSSTGPIGSQIWIS